MVQNARVPTDLNYVYDLTLTLIQYGANPSVSIDNHSDKSECALGGGGPGPEWGDGGPGPELGSDDPGPEPDGQSGPGLGPNGPDGPLWTSPPPEADPDFKTNAEFLLLLMQLDEGTRERIGHK